VHIDTDNADPNDLNDFWDQFNPEFPILAGCGDLINSWGVGYIPHTTLLDDCGVVLGNWVGWSDGVGEQIHAIIEQYLDSPPLAVSEVNVLTETDGDGIIEPGETATLDVLLEDLCTEACAQVSAQLTSEFDWLTVTQPTGDYPDFEPGDIFGNETPYAIVVAAAAPPVFDVELSLEITVADQSWDLPVPLSGGERTVYYTAPVEATEPDWLVENAPGWEGQWYISQLDFNSPDYSWHCGDDLGGSYANHQDSRLITPPLELLPYSRLCFQHRMAAEISSTYPDSAYDGGVVYVSVDDGVSWAQLFPLAGYNKAFRWESGGGNPATHPFPGGTPCFSGQFDWREDCFDLEEYGEQTVRFRFRFGSDNGGGEEGWFLDDLTLLGYDEEQNVSHRSPLLPEETRLTAVYPNPFNSATRIEYYLRGGGAVRLLVHDLLGRRVATIDAGRLPTGHHYHTFDAVDLATGVYLVNLRVDGRSFDQRKLLLVK